MTVTEPTFATDGGGVQLLQVPGPTNLPGAVLQALSRPLIDHRGPEFATLARECLAGLSELVGGPIALYPASGTGAWEAALVNVLAPGDRVLAFDHGFFAGRWQAVASGLGLQVDAIPCDWRRAIDPAALEERLAADREHTLKAVLLVHNETSTGVLNPVREARAVLDRLGHPALLMVDVISSLASTEYHHDEWGVDVTIGASQKGLMLPPGLSFNAVSERALHAAGTGHGHRSYFDWGPMLAAAESGMFPYTPATSLMFGLHAALALIRERGLPAIIARHVRHAEAVRHAVQAWGLELYCVDQRAYSTTVTAVLAPVGFDADALRTAILERHGMALGAGLGPLRNKVVRLGHLGDFNDLMLCAMLAGVELGLRETASGLPVRGGIVAALDVLAAGPAEGAIPRAGHPSGSPTQGP